MLSTISCIHKSFFQKEDISIIKTCTTTFLLSAQGASIAGIAVILSLSLIQILPIPAYFSTIPGAALFFCTLGDLVFAVYIFYRSKKQPINSSENPNIAERSPSTVKNSKINQSTNLRVSQDINLSEFFTEFGKNPKNLRGIAKKFKSRIGFKKAMQALKNTTVDKNDRSESADYIKNFAVVTISAYFLTENKREKILEDLRKLSLPHNTLTPDIIIDTLFS